MFEAVSSSPSFPEIEETILAFWKDRGIYEKSLNQRAKAPKFVFYEGPPTANGLPHPGHCLTRAIKDVFPRYKTMRGFLCERKAGWDTHGLPVEVEVCKELGIHSKEEIEEFGVEPFIQKCQQSVWRYMQEWERLTERIGFWIRLDEAYVTYHQSYVESVWWSLKNLFDRGLLYQGHKIVWWWAQGGTALSAGEVGQGYRETADPSVFVKFPLLDDAGSKTDTSLIVWTTTPWTLPSNQFAAVHPQLQYATVVDNESGEKYILAADLVEAVAAKAKREFTVEGTQLGEDLLGRRYLPPFDYYYKNHGNAEGELKDGGKQHIAWRIVAADFVTTDSGTGVVHQAPAFGEVDYEVLQAEQERFVEGAGPQLINAVGPNGKFTSEAADWEGRWVKEADKDISRDLRERGLLFHLDQYLHEYPFCWRAAEDPLIQYPRQSWFIRTTKFKDDLVKNNSQINWLPEHIRDGRMGNFLESNVDWALSRERYWGTPLPIWVCEETGKKEAIESYDELLAKPGVAGADVWEKAKAANPDLPDDLRVHKPYIDAVTYDSPFAEGARMQRVTEVIDCWYDSGAMPFAQWGYPHTGKDRFVEQFPADFISEALDQTRGWFYSQLAISTMLFGEHAEKELQQSFPHPFKNCIVLGLMLAEWWKDKNGKEIALSEALAKEKFGKGKFEHKTGKMSKQLRNYRSPQEIFDVYGADALRWYFFANQAPWNSILYSERSIKESIPEFLLRLWHTFRTLVIYAEMDGFDPASELSGEVGDLKPSTLADADGYTPVAQRGELDRWLMSELQATVAEVIQRMDDYDNYNACRALHGFVDGLSNWYVRRSRDRFWSSDKQSADKRDAYYTLYECLVTVTKLIAPFTPFVAEKLWGVLTSGFGDRVTESVHLCDYPAPDESVLDEQLSSRMQLLREIASLGRSARMDAKLRVRQPLARVEVILGDQCQAHHDWLCEHNDLLLNELNVKAVEYPTEAAEYISYEVVPNFKRLGPKVGKNVPAVKKALQNAAGGELLAELESTGKITLELADTKLELDEQDIEIRLAAKEGWAAAQGAGCVVVLATELTDELIREGYAKDLIRFIQEQRKQLDLAYDARIVVGVTTDSYDLQQALSENAETIAAETLANELDLSSIAGVEQVDQTIGDFEVKIYVKAV